MVIAIIAILAGILLASLEMARNRSYRMQCANNLRQIGQSLEIYAGENKGAYPRTIYKPGAPPVAGTGGAAADPFGVGGPEPNDVTAAMFLLMRVQKLDPAIFICPYTDVNVFQIEPGKPLLRSNFTDYHKNLGYSYANPYPDAAAEAAGYQLRSHMKAQFAVAADLNPGAKFGPNARNHEDAGQNVLFADGHVSWAPIPKMGINEDDIYHNAKGELWGSPADANDSVLLPTE